MRKRYHAQSTTSVSGMVLPGNGDQPFQLHVPLGDETHVSRDDGALVHRESWIK